jgi:hypothetical protein
MNAITKFIVLLSRSYYRGVTIVTIAEFYRVIDSWVEIRSTNTVEEFIVLLILYINLDGYGVYRVIDSLY